tara:strand:- start:4565 stop:5239 length:675 start_codon:yes stop_codon:yes gene_type:complete
MLLTLAEKDYYIPQKWSEVTLGSYQRFMELAKDETDEHTQALNTISALTGAPQGLLEKCKKEDIDEVLKCVAGLLTHKVNTTLNTHITIDGVEYGFHPKLKDLTMAEFVDLDNNLKEPWENMHRVMAILYRPITNKKKNKYDIEEYDSTKCMQNAEKFKDALSIATVNGASGFFLIIAEEYQVVLQSYLNKQQKKMKKTTKMQKNSLTTNGVGTELSSTSPTMI